MVYAVPVIIAFLDTRIFLAPPPTKIGGEGEHSASDCPHRHYIAILHRFLATEHTNIIEFMPPKRAIPAPPPEPARKSSRPTTPTKKKVAFQSERDRRAAEREKAAQKKAEQERLEKAERLANLETDGLDELLRDEQNRTKARTKKAREVNLLLVRRGIAEKILYKAVFAFLRQFARLTSLPSLRLDGRPIHP